MLQLECSFNGFYYEFMKTHIVKNFPYSYHVIKPIECFINFPMNFRLLVSRCGFIGIFLICFHACQFLVYNDLNFMQEKIREVFF